MSETSTYEVGYDTSSLPAQSVRRRLGLLEWLDATLPSPAQVAADLDRRFADSCVRATGATVNASPVTRVRAFADALSAQPVLSRLSGQPQYASTMQAVGRALASAERLEAVDPEAAGAHARRAFEALTSVAGENHARLTQAWAAEMEVVVTAALHDDMGYRVEVARGTDGFALRATSGQKVVVVVVEQGSRMTLDIAGCDGPSCQPVARELCDALERRGLELDRRHLLAHDDPSGGTLISLADRGRRGLESLVAREPASDGAVTPSVGDSGRGSLGQDQDARRRLIGHLFSTDEQPGGPR